MDRDALLEACRRVDAAVRARPEYAHTSHLHVRVEGAVAFDAHYRGPPVADVFSVTKAVAATLVGIAVRRGLVRDLDEPLDAVLDLAGTPSAGQSWRDLLTMTRGSRVDGPWDIDAVMALPNGWLRRVAEAPRVHVPGRVFAYDNGGYLLLGAALAEVAGEPLSGFAARELFGPLGIREWRWLRSPEGVDVGAAHLRLRAGDLGRLAELWMDGGGGLVDPGFATAMVTAHSAGGPPEEHPYGFGLWIDPDGFFAGGWAGQHVLCLPRARAVVVTTGDPRFDPGPPPTDALPAGWRPALELVREHVVPVLLGGQAASGGSAPARRSASSATSAS
jgi:CubicO group peptidase (beta-lactamase class C family)